jgi:hypothetical protein
MEYILVAIILFIIGRIVVKILPSLSFKNLFLIASVVLLIWLVIQETSKWGIIVTIGGAILSAWRFAKWIKNKGKPQK